MDGLVTSGHKPVHDGPPLPLQIGDGRRHIDLGHHHPPDRSRCSAKPSPGDLTIAQRGPPHHPNRRIQGRPGRSPARLRASGLDALADVGFTGLDPDPEDPVIITGYKATSARKTTPAQRQANQALSAARAPVEHGFSDLKDWRTLTRLRIDPAKATTVCRLTHNPTTAASPWLSEHGHGKYAVSSRLTAVLGLAFTQVELAAGIRQHAGL